MDRHRILLASDEIDVFLQLEGIFALRSDIEVLLARTEDQVLARAGLEKPDLILIDYDMAGADGENLCRRIRMLLSDSGSHIIPLVSERELETAAGSGPVGEGEYILKPIEPQKFLSTMDRCLGGERRAAPRVPARLRINYGIEGRDLLTDYSVNLSSGGVFIETTDLLPPETPLFLEFSLPESGGTIRCKGRVAWINHHRKILSPLLPPGMGVQFLDLGLQEMHIIRDFLNEESFEPSW